MNANTKKRMIIVIAGLLVLTLASCNSPTDPRMATETPSTGIDSDPATGLRAGLSLEGDAILENTSVDTSEGLDGLEWVEGISGNAMRIDADGEFVRITDDTLTDNRIAGTVEAWIYPEGEASDHYYTGIVHKGEMIDYSDEAWSLQFYNNLKPLFYFVSENDTAVWMKAPAAISLNEWHFLAASWNYDADTDDTTITLYVDGEVVVTDTRNGIGPVKASDGDLLIGSQIPDPYEVDPTYGHFTFNGIIDEVALYDTERTAVEILATYLDLISAP